MGRILGVDVDLTICPSDKGWREWLKERCSVEYPLGDYESPPYDLGTQFAGVDDPYKYWRELDYSQFQPIEGSVECLRELSKHFQIVFISRIKGNHTKSKYYWLKEHFPFMYEYVACHKKHVMNKAVECMIDDRLDVLKGFEPQKRVLYNTPYTQSDECAVMHQFSVWDERIVKEICGYYW